jgi:Putative Ig domain/Carboxypeptidase regulatory-like domain
MEFRVGMPFEITQGVIAVRRIRVLAAGLTVLLAIGCVGATSASARSRSRATADNPLVENGFVSGTVKSASSAPVADVKITLCSEDEPEFFEKTPEETEKKQEEREAEQNKNELEREKLEKEGNVEQAEKERLEEEQKIEEEEELEEQEESEGVEVPTACYSAETEAAGHYAISGVPDGPYLITATPAANSGYGEAPEGEVDVSGEATTTENFTLPEAGTVTGTVTNEEHEAVSGASVTVCGQICESGTSNVSGVYTITDVPDGSYVATISPATRYNDARSEEFSVNGTGTSTVNVSLTSPHPLPNGTYVTGVGETNVNGVEMPIVNWEEEAPLTTKGCVGGRVSVTISGHAFGGPGPLESTSPRELTETPASSGSFSGLLPKVYPIHALVTMTFTVSGCAHAGEEKTVETEIWIDPSGVVLDGDDGGAPLPGATVTLMASKTDLRAGPFAAVPNGSTVMSPANRTNPGSTNGAGEFGWDAIPGYYRVQATELGCGTASTAIFRVPPPRKGLELVLHCVLRIDTTSIPAAKLGVAYEAKLKASGESAPFKWKKLNKLPKGLKFNAKTGVISGTMKTGKVAPGTYTIRVQVTDHSKRKRTASFTLAVS